MATITPSRRLVSDRFPVVSFAVNVPPDRLFEIACATHPALLGADHSHLRTPSNFFTSRMGGLLRAPAGHATYLVPSEQLRRFAGQGRLYYAVGSYRDPRGADARFSVSPVEPQRIPFIQLSADFSGKTLDRGRIARAPSDARYGGAGAVLTWGGDQIAVAAPAAPPPAAPSAYDDGFPPELWTRGEHGHGAALGNRDVGGAALEPAPALRDDAFGGEPPGFEDAPALRLEEEVAVYGGARPRTPARAVASPRPRPSQVTAGPARAAAPVRAMHGAEPAGTEHPPVVAPSARPRLGGATVAPEHPRSPGGARRPGPAGAVAGEPLGAEDGVDLRRRARGPARYGRMDMVGAAAPVSPAAPAPAATDDSSNAFRLDGADDEFDDRVDEPEPPPGAFGVASLTIAEKYQLVLPVARLISGPQGYSAVNADAQFNDHSHAAYQRMHHGLEWGFVLASQRSGALGRVLEACERRDGARFAETFGAAADRLLVTTTAETPEERLQPVDGALLWQEPWLSRFRAAGEVAAFRAAQNEVAIEGSLDPNLPLASALGFDSTRALAMLFDRCVQMGNGAGTRFVVRAVSPLVGPQDERAALEALGFATVQAFQESAGLAATGRFATRTTAAMIQALRGLGDASPVHVPPLAEMLDRLVTAARGRRFAQRVAALRTAPELDDTERRPS
jgi:hypothetical protein